MLELIQAFTDSISYIDSNNEIDLKKTNPVALKNIYENINCGSNPFFSNNNNIKFLEKEIYNHVNDVNDINDSSFSRIEIKKDKNIDTIYFHKD